MIWAMDLSIFSRAFYSYFFGLTSSPPCGGVCPWFIYYNFGRIRQTLRVTAVTEAGLSDHVWSIAESCDLQRKSAECSSSGRRAKDPHLSLTVSFTEEALERPINTRLAGLLGDEWSSAEEIPTHGPNLKEIVLAAPSRLKSWPGPVR